MSTTTWIVIAIVVGILIIFAVIAESARKKQENADIEKGVGPSVLVREYGTSQEFQIEANRLAEQGYQVQTTSGENPLSVTYVKEAIKPTGEKSGSTPLLADEFKKLADLKSLNILTEDEFQRAKALFLGKPPDKREEALVILKNLHSLYKSGVLSESEFNMKKWDILSRKV